MQKVVACVGTGRGGSKREYLFINHKALRIIDAGIAKHTLDLKEARPFLKFETTPRAFGFAASIST